jgi:hypothetical protein
MGSVLQWWVEELPARAQGTLLTGVRGCDDTPKMPLDSTARQLTAFYRWCILNPADVREVGIEPGAFFQDAPPLKWKPSELGHLPLHWVSHLMHCFEVVGYYRPHGFWPSEANGPTYQAAEGFVYCGARDWSCTRCLALEIYDRIARSLHLNPESFDQMVQRLTEDRIVSNTVVS